MAKTSEAFAEVDLIGKAHPTYYGPVYRIGSNTWIYYQDEPLEVIHVLGKWFKQRYPV